MLFTINDAQYIGLRLKSILKYLGERPAGATNSQLERDFPISSVGNNLASLLELAICRRRQRFAIAAGLIADSWEGDVQVFRRN